MIRQNIIMKSAADTASFRSANIIIGSLAVAIGLFTIVVMSIEDYVYFPSYLSSSTLSYVFVIMCTIVIASQFLESGYPALLLVMVSADILVVITLAISNEGYTHFSGYSLSSILSYVFVIVCIIVITSQFSKSGHLITSSMVMALVTILVFIALVVAGTRGSVTLCNVLLILGIVISEWNKDIPKDNTMNFI